MMQGMKKPHLTVYGIPNCATVKKARAWLASHGLEHDFHDFKKQGVPAERLPDWLAAAGWEKLVNRQGTTWRKLDASVQATVQDAASASHLMQAQPSVIKRPVLEWQQSGHTHITVGFAPERWEELLALAD